MQRELCFLTSSGWSVPSIQPTLLQPHQSPACHFAQTASKYLFYWLRLLHWLAKARSFKMHTWCLPNLQHFLLIAVVRSLIHLVLTRLTTVRSGSIIRHSEGFCSSCQMCSHVEIITYLLAVFILSHTDWIITYFSFVQRHYCIMQMLIVMDLVPQTKYYWCSYHILQCSQQLVSWENEAEIAQHPIHIYGTEHSALWWKWLFYP